MASHVVNTRSFGAFWVLVVAFFWPVVCMEEVCMCSSDRMVPDCCCDFRSTSLLNDQHILPPLQRLAEETSFFRYYRVALCGQCHHDLPSPTCGHPECSVCECSAEDLPCDSSGKCYLFNSEASFQPSAAGLDVSSSSAVESAPEEDDCPSGLTEGDGTVDRTLGEFQHWTESRSEWMGDSADALDFVDLHLNPEKWTGYVEATGSSAVWAAIHEQSRCFNSTGGAQCREQRVFEKLISGLHASIGVHISVDFCMQPGGKYMPCKEFGESTADFQRRLYDHPERIENLYFAYLFMLRAVVKAAPLLKTFDYDAGDPAEAAMIREEFAKLFQHRDVPCLGVTRYPFDESTVFADENGEELREQFRTGFLSISSIMDCVGCQKCRLWGKLQAQGLSVALRLLFGDKDRSTPVLSRTEVIALVHTLFRFSSSVSNAARMAQELADFDPDL